MSSTLLIRRRRQWLVYFFALLLLPAPLLALDLSRQNSQFTHRVWDSQDGLPSNTVWDVHMASNGYLWLATEAGLARFDGASFKTFSSESNDAFTVDDTRGIAAAPDGSLWIATYGGGVVRLLGDQLRNYGTADGLDNPIVYRVFVAADGVLWAGTATSACRLIQERFECFDGGDGLGASRVYDISQSRDGTLWFSSLDSGISSFNGTTFTNYSADQGLDSLQVFTVASDPEYDVVFGTYQNGFFSFDGERFRRIVFDGLPDSVIPLTYFRDSQDNVWIGSNTHGLLSAYPEIRRVDSAGTEELQVFSIAEDAVGGLWLATTSGLHHYSAPPFLPWGAEEGLANATFVIDEGPDGSIWTGVEGVGLYRIDPTNNINRFTVDDGLPGSSVSSILVEPDGLVWAGTFTSGIAWLRDGRVIGTLSEDDGLASNQVSALYRDSKGVVWIGTAAGLNRFSRGEITHRLSTENGLITNLVRFISEDTDGNLQLSTDRGLVVIDTSSVSVSGVLNREHGLGTDIVATSYVDERGVTWVGGRSGGLSRIENGKVFSFAAKHHLGTESVMGIVQDTLGHLWLSGRNGTVRIQRSQLDGVAQGDRQRVDARPITFRDGMRTPQVPGGFQSPIIVASDGRVWLASTKGLAVVDPSELTPYATVPAVNIDSITADGKAITRSANFTVPAGTQSIQIAYSSASLSNGEALRFRYRLRDDNERWQDAGTRRTAFFTSLSPGTHELQVQARMDGQGFSGNDLNITRFAFSVDPHWYQTLTVKVSVGIVLLALLWFLYQYLSRTQRRREQRLESLVTERTRALSDALDQVQRVSRIDMLTQVANRRHFEERLNEVWQAALKRAAPVSVMLLDIDHFKILNDTAGHQAGDRALKSVAETLAKTVRDEDFVARYGGEEFIILMSGADTEKARHVAERVQLAIRELGIPHPGLKDASVLSVSAGFATAQPGQVSSAEALIRRADEALYRAKASGRDRMVTAALAD